MPPCSIPLLLPTSANKAVLPGSHLASSRLAAAHFRPRSGPTRHKREPIAGSSPADSEEKTKSFPAADRVSRRQQLPGPASRASDKVEISLAPLPLPLLTSNRPVAPVSHPQPASNHSLPPRYTPILLHDPQLVLGRHHPHQPRDIGYRYCEPLAADANGKGARQRLSGLERARTSSWASSFSGTVRTSKSTLPIYTPACHTFDSFSLVQPCLPTHLCLCVVAVTHLVPVPVPVDNSPSLGKSRSDGGKREDKHHQYARRFRAGRASVNHGLLLSLYVPTGIACISLS